MEARTRDLIFGTGRTGADLQGTFASPGMVAGGREKGGILSTWRGINGWGREGGLKVMERVGLITAEQRAANGPVGIAADAALDLDTDDHVRTIVRRGGRGGADAVRAGQSYANPVYGGSYAQMLMRDQGFVPPMDAPAGVAEPTYLIAEGGTDGLHVVDDVAATTVDGGGSVAAAADNAVNEVATLEQEMIGSLKRLMALPADQQVPALARAVDASAAHGLGDDAFGVLGSALEARSLNSSVHFLNQSIDEGERLVAAATAATIADDAGKAIAATTPLADEVAKVVAPASDAIAASLSPVADDIADIVAKAVPKVVEAAVPKVVDAAIPAVRAATTRSLLVGGADALRGVMPFAAGVDDTLRLLAKI